MNFKVGDWVRVSNCCNGRINELSDSSAIVEIDAETGGEILYVWLEELQPLMED